LVRLNDLATFDLISICEGHCGRQAEPSRTSPHIKLRLKERYLPSIASYWDKHKMAILGKVNEFFQVGGDTYVNLELKFKLRSGTGRLSYQEEMIVRVHGRQARTAEEMGPVTRTWFQESVERIEEIDRFITSLWQGEEQ
jgi:hypothetical protein